MYSEISRILTRAPNEVVADMIGLAAIFVVLFVGLVLI